MRELGVLAAARAISAFVATTAAVAPGPLLVIIGALERRIVVVVILYEEARIAYLVLVEALVLLFSLALVVKHGTAAVTDGELERRIQARLGSGQCGLRRRLSLGACAIRLRALKRELCEFELRLGNTPRVSGRCSVLAAALAARVADAAVGEDLGDLSPRFHLERVGGWPDPETLCATQQHVEVVVPVVVQPGARATGRSIAPHPQVVRCGRQVSHQRGAQWRVACCEQFGHRC
mmetsp:Transcript_10563/g.43677  ORF Transcript_10563/g.43677 Transcript_10563/m.43677 type:complete len:235 (-) Transcript_10563:344-1048(-)